MEQIPKLILISFMSEVTVVMLSIYLPLRAYDLGADNFVVGVIGGASSAVYMIMPFTMGRLSDRVGARRILSSGAIIILALSLSYLLVSNPLELIPLRIFEGVGWSMIWPPLESLISRSGSNPYRSLAKFNMAWGVGAAAAPVLGGGIATLFEVRFTFLAASLAMLVALFFAFYTRPPEEGHVNTLAQRYSAPELQRTSLLPLYFAIMYGVTTTIVTTFFPRYASLLSFSVIQWGSTIALLLVGRFLAFSMAERVRLRIGLKNMFGPFALVGIAFPAFTIIAGSNFLLASLSSFVTGLSLGFVYSATLNKIMIGPPQSRGRAAGLFESSIGLGSFFGPPAAGLLAQYGLWMTFILPLAALLLAAVIGTVSRGSLSID
jgi:DHA1 family multidrug resistance protein-like MFS transporter